MDQPGSKRYLVYILQVHEGPAAVLAQYRNAVARARPDDARDLALARQFVLPGRCGGSESHHALLHSCRSRVAAFEADL